MLELNSKQYQKILLFAFALIFLAYSFQVYSVALNADDISNLEAEAGLMVQGRWANGLLYDKLLGHLPHPALRMRSDCLCRCSPASLLDGLLVYIAQCPYS
jgi:hypothetical protein